MFVIARNFKYGNSNVLIITRGSVICPPPPIPEPKAFASFEQFLIASTQARSCGEEETLKSQPSPLTHLVPHACAAVCGKDNAIQNWGPQCSPNRFSQSPVVFELAPGLLKTVQRRRPRGAHPILSTVANVEPFPTPNNSLLLIVLPSLAQADHEPSIPLRRPTHVPAILPRRAAPTEAIASVLGALAERP